MEQSSWQHLVFPGAGEMVRRMRDYPWERSALGDPRDWPSSLRTACRICLTSRFPMIVWWGPELRFLYNDAYRPLLGDKHPALGLPGRQIWSEIWDTIGPMLESVLSTGQATWSQDLLLPLRRHDYLEETYWTYSYSPLHDEVGTIRGIFTAVSETTEQVVGRHRLAVLQELGAQETRAQSVIEVCELVVRSLARAGQVVPYVAIYLRDQPPEGESSAGTAQTIASSAPDLSPGWPVDEVLRSGQPAVLRDVGERFGPLPSGGWPEPPTEAMVLALQGDGGSAPIGVIVLAANAGRALDGGYQDFLALVAQQTAAMINGAIAYQAQLSRAEELAELDRAKTIFFSNISHEFRTPLTLITSPLEELRRRVDPADATARVELEVIHRNSLRLGKLVNSLLDFSRIEAGRMRASYEPVDLGAFTTELASVFRSAIERAGLRYEVDCPPLSAPADVDRDMWERIVLNLLSNALKFTLEGSVTVTLAELDGEAILRIADTGSGIPAAELPHLFDRFHRVQNTRARSNEGSGIGLALVRELVTLHGGTITAESTEHQGTAFTVRVPFSHPGSAAHGPAAPAPVSAEPYLQEAMRWLPAREDSGAVAGAGPDAPRVLLADDNSDMREYLSRLLSPSYQVSAVTDGQAALEAARAHPPDIVISDVMMPRLDGLALVAELRADPRTADVPVLLLSARAGPEAAIDGLDAGADDYLIKPFAATELLARVRASVRLSRMRHHHANWRTALTESLHEAFFLCGPDGTVLEANSAFSAILGYGPDTLPSPPPHPWWPDSTSDADACRLAASARQRMAEESGGDFAIQLRHRDRHRLWVAGSFNEINDPERGRLVVGTFRDVTTEHYAIQRESALAKLGSVLARAASTTDTLSGALGELHRLWQARHAVAAIWTDALLPSVTASVAGLTWNALPAGEQAVLSALREHPPLTPAEADGGVGISLEHPLGILTIRIGLPARRSLSAEDQTLLSLMCGRLSQALHRAHQIDEQRETALALQRAILGPAKLPRGFSARYEPASRPLEVGGDWHDILGLPDGRIAIVVGDCVGHDLSAATGMGQLRSACRALLLQDASPGRALAAMDRFAASVPGTEYTTVFCAVLDPETGQLTYSSAGHPPAIVTRPDGGVVLLEDARSFPLAARPGTERLEAHQVLPPRSTLLLYTDGLVERRGRSLTDGIAQAGAAVVSGGEGGLEDLATQLMADLAPGGGYADDVAIVLYRHPAPLELAFPASLGEISPARTRLRRWLDRCDLSIRTAQDTLIAAGEAVANAIEHGHRDHPGQGIRLRAAATASHLQLSIADTGRWLPPRPEPAKYRGRGLELMRAVMDHVSIDAGTAGTTVTMDVRIASGNSA